jgi:hypothetical protein
MKRTRSTSGGRGAREGQSHAPWPGLRVRPVETSEEEWAIWEVAWMEDRLLDLRDEQRAITRELARRKRSGLSGN